MAHLFDVDKLTPVSARMMCAAMLMAWSGLHAQSLNVESLKREVQAAVLTAEQIKVHANKQALREGDALVLSVELPASGYLNVVSINPKGVPTVLFPNQLQSDNKVPAGLFSFPDERMHFNLQASPPYGPSLIVAFLTQDQLDLYATGEGGAAKPAQDAAFAGNAGSTHTAANLATVATTVAGLVPGLHQFALLSAVGRDLIQAFSTKNIAVTPGSHAPMAAGMTTVMVCPRTGPCNVEQAALSADVTQMLDAFAPGILLEPEDKTLTKDVKELRPLSDKGLTLTKASEGFVPRLYEDAAGYCTIAYGHLLRKERCDGRDRQAFPRGISEPQGGDLLLSDMSRAQRAVMSMVKVPLSDGQYAALCDFTYNVGTNNLKRSALLRAVNAGEHRRVPFQMRRWTMAGGRAYRGLQLRREREIAMYFEGGSVPTIMPKGEDTSPLDIRTGEPSAQ